MAWFVGRPLFSSYYFDVVMSAKHLKKQLRQRILQTRKHLSPTHCARASSQLCTKLQHNLYFKRAKRIAFYFAQNGEIDPIALIQQVSTHGKSIYLPRLSSHKHNTLIFLQVTKDTKLYQNKYGIPEPKITPAAITPPYLLDLILCPLVAFDLQGHRLGMGGGYYDRTFKFKKHTKHKPLLVGLAHDFQQCPHVPFTDRDIALDMVVTPTRVIKF